MAICISPAHSNEALLLYVNKLFILTSKLSQPTYKVKYFETQ